MALQVLENVILTKSNRMLKSVLFTYMLVSEKGEERDRERDGKG